MRIYYGEWNTSRPILNLLYLDPIGTHFLSPHLALRAGSLILIYGKRHPNSSVRLALHFGHIEIPSFFSTIGVCKLYYPSAQLIALSGISPCCLLSLRVRDTSGLCSFFGTSAHPSEDSAELDCSSGKKKSAQNWKGAPKHYTIGFKVLYLYWNAVFSGNTSLKRHSRVKKTTIVFLINICSAFSRQQIMK